MACARIEETPSEAVIVPWRQGRAVEPVGAREKRRRPESARGSSSATSMPSVERVPGKDQDELVASVTRQRGPLVGDRALQDVADLAKDLASREVPVPVVDRLQVVEVEEDDAQVAAVAGDARKLLGQAQVEVALVVEAGQPVSLGHLVGAPRVEQVLDRDRSVVGEDLEEAAVLLAEAAGPQAVDELEHAAHRRLDADRHAQHGLGLELAPLVQVG